MEVNRQTGASWVEPYPPLGLGRLLLALGDPDAATHLLQGLRLAEENADSQALDIAHCFLAEMELQEGHPDRAEHRLRQAGISETWDTGKSDASLPTILVFARTLGALKKTAEARRMVDAVITQARAAGEMLVLAEALPIRAWLAFGAGDPAGAEHDVTEGLALARAAGYPLAEALALERHGLMALREGRVDEARERLQAALGIFGGLRAARHVEWVQAALRDCADEHDRVERASSYHPRVDSNH
jgi:ATP/maltotriose-dependent transcriptional regulator MalT